MIVTRDFGVIANYCDRVIVMSEGRVVEMDNVRTFFDRASHPVSLLLMRSTFAAKGKRNGEAETKTYVNTQTISTAGELKEIEPGHFVRIEA
jgi:ABC-type dipeptide/oligopeptide/nickel transport system ATPase component